MAVANNPASRLYDVLSQVFTNAPDHRRSKETLATALGRALGVQSPLGVWEQLASIRQMAADVAQAFADEDMDADAWTDPWWDELRKVLDAAAQQGLNLTMVHLDDHELYMSANALRMLKANGQYFEKHSPRPSLSDDQLAELRDLINDLREAVTEAEGVTPHLRVVLLTYLREMERVMAHVRLLGPEGLADVVAQGVAVLYQESRSVPDTEQNVETLSKWRDLLLKAKAWVGLGRSAAALVGLESGEDVRKALAAGQDMLDKL